MEVRYVYAAGRGESLRGDAQAVTFACEKAVALALGEAFAQIIFGLQLKSLPRMLRPYWDCNGEARAIARLRG